MNRFVLIRWRRVGATPGVCSGAGCQPDARLRVLSHARRADVSHQAAGNARASTATAVAPARCASGAGRGADGFSEEASRKNFEAVSRFVVPGSPRASRFLRHPLAREAGGDSFHGGGKHWQSRRPRVPDPRRLGSGATNAASRQGRRRRIIQTNAAGDNTHVIDPATNKVVGIIEDIEIPHGVTSAPDGSRIYITNESRSTPSTSSTQELEGDQADHAERPAEQRAVTQGRPEGLRRHRAGARRARRHRHGVADERQDGAGRRARSTTSTSRPTASSPSPARSPRARSASSTRRPTSWPGRSR